MHIPIACSPFQQTPPSLWWGHHMHSYFTFTPAITPPCTTSKNCIVRSVNEKRIDDTEMKAVLWKGGEILLFTGPAGIFISYLSRYANFPGAQNQPLFSLTLHGWLGFPVIYYLFHLSVKSAFSLLFFSGWQMMSPRLKVLPFATFFRWRVPTFLSRGEGDNVLIFARWTPLFILSYSTGESSLMRRKKFTDF